MEQFVYKGIYVSDEIYDIHDSVKYGSNYYYALIPGPVSIPTNENEWENIGTDVIETTAIKQVYLLRNYTSYDVLQESIVDYNQIIDTNSNGLYMFPSKYSLTNDSSKERNLMGLKLVYTYAKQFLNANIESMPNITAIYFMQAERIKNVITQGFAVSGVERVGFDLDVPWRYASDPIDYQGRGTYNYKIIQELGNKQNQCVFPWMDGSNIKMFPVMGIVRSKKETAIGYSDPDFVWRYDGYSIMHLPSTSADPGAYFTTEQNFDKYLTNLGFEFIGRNKVAKQLVTDKICIYSPDILLDNNLAFSTVYLKPKYKFYRLRNENPSYSPTGKYKMLLYTSAVDFILRYRQPDYIGTLYNDDLERFFNPTEDKYDLVNSNLFIEGESSIIAKNVINSNFYGFSSSMKSIIDIYGDDIRIGSDTTESSTIQKYINTNRSTLFNAGVLLNRSRMTDSDTFSEEIQLADNKEHVSEIGVFGLKSINAHTGITDRKSVPLVFTNLSMNSNPYLACKLTEKYNVLENEDKSNKYSFLNNGIVDICKYNNMDEYISDAENFNILDIEYQFKYVDDNFLLKSTSDDIYKGDLFSQKVSMRMVRWGSKSERTQTNYNDFTEAWKSGIAFNLYLQLNTNANLRSQTSSDVFYPAILNETSLGDSQEITDLFTWKSELERFKNESWNYNTAYSLIGGLYKLFAFNDIFLKKNSISKNRIRYSNKHISGAFIDGYKTLPADQYQDFGFEYGSINKLITSNNILFSIQQRSINQHFSSSNLQTSNDTNTIITGNKEIISDQYRQLAEYGTQHKESVVSGSQGIYGVDYNKEIIWRIKGNGTSFGVENLVDTKSLFDIFNLFKGEYTIDKQDLYGGDMQGIVSSYDEDNKEVLFTFQVKEFSYTLVFNERFDFFTGFYSYDVNFYMKLNKNLYSFTNGGRNDVVTNLWKHNVGNYLNFHGLQNSLNLEFIVNCKSEKDASEFEKEFLSHLINSSPTEFSNIQWNTQYQSTYKSPFINETEFWSNPEYLEHVWTVPIPNNKINPGIGPRNNNEFFIFENNSKMKGQWLKVSIFYTGSNYTYIKNVITNFIISYS